MATVEQIVLSCTFEKAYSRASQQYARNRLREGLIQRGFDLIEDGRFELRARFCGPWTGSRGVPVTTRFAKVRIKVVLSDSEGTQALVEGQADGVVDEGDVSWHDASRKRRLNRAIDSAIGKLGRRLSYLRMPWRSPDEADPTEAATDFEFLPINQRDSLAVIDFNAGQGISPEAGRALTDICTNAVAETNQFRLLDRENIKSILGEQDFAAVVKCDETKCLVTYGKILHAQKMIHGRVSRLGDRHVLYIALVDVNTSQIDATATTFVGLRVEDFVDAVPTKTRELIAAALKVRNEAE